MADELSEAAIRAIHAAVSEAVRAGGPTSQPGMIRVPEDDRLRAMVEDVIDRKLLVFETKVKDIIHEQLEDTLRRIGIKIDDDHIDETADQIRSVLATHKFLNKLKMGIGMTFFAGLFFGLLKLLGLNIGSFTGGDH